MALITVVQDDLYDLGKWSAASEALVEKGEKEADRVLRRYSADDLIRKIQEERNEPNMAKFVQHLAEGASSEEDRYLIAETAYVILDTIQTWLDPEYHRLKQKPDGSPG